METPIRESTLGCSSFCMRAISLQNASKALDSRGSVRSSLTATCRLVVPPSEALASAPLREPLLLEAPPSEEVLDILDKERFAPPGPLRLEVLPAELSFVHVALKTSANPPVPTTWPMSSELYLMIRTPSRATESMRVEAQSGDQGGGEGERWPRGLVDRGLLAPAAAAKRGMVCMRPRLSAAADKVPLAIDSRRCSVWV
mmetsp:Transcript_81846/g.162958  ORF Transcript_81846/g.162958 Transcript_81846/m.162958 type:complete len:200 (+) Transcript_81846:94-693(+)